MKTTLHLFLLLGLLQFGFKLNAQHLKIGEEISKCAKKSTSAPNNAVPSYWTYDHSEKEFTYCFDEKLVTNKVKLPTEDKKIDWHPVSEGDHMYFSYSTFEKDIYSLYYAKYDVINNKIGEAKLVLQTESKSNPEINFMHPTTFSNKNYFTVSTYAGKGQNTATSNYFIMSSTVFSVLDYDLNPLYSVNLPFEYSEKEFKYDVANLFTEDGTWYRFGIKYEGKGDEKKGIYGCFITTPEGNTSPFKPISFDTDKFISDINLDFEGNKLIQYGIWSNIEGSNEMSGTYYIEYDANNLNVLTKQIKTFDNADLSKFIYLSGAEKKIDKRQSINGMEYVYFSDGGHQFENGNYVAVYRRKVKSLKSDYSYELGSILIATFGPKADQMTANIVKLNQNGPGTRAGFECGATFMNNQVIIIFNDNIGNANITTEGDPKVFEPYPGQAKTIATFAIFMNENGAIKREQILSYSADNLFFHQMGKAIDNETFYIYTVNDSDYSYFKTGDDDKISKRAVHFTE